MQARQNMNMFHQSHVKVMDNNLSIEILQKSTNIVKSYKNSDNVNTLRTMYTRRLMIFSIS